MVKSLYERVLITFNHNQAVEYYLEADILKNNALSDNPSKYTVMSNRFKSYRDKGLLVVRTHDGYQAELPLANITQIVWLGEYVERNNIRDDARRLAELKNDGTWQVAKE